MTWDAINAAVESNRLAMVDVGATFQKATRGDLNEFQFDIFRRNYVFRTVSSVYTVAATVAAAIRHDTPDLTAALRTTYGALLEELGAPPQPGSRVVSWTDPESRSHITLLFDCMNRFSRACFPELAELSPSDLAWTEGLLPETYAYRAAHYRLFDPANYAATMGAAFAQELAAEGMLKMLLDSFFRPLSDTMSEAETDIALKYFDVHLNGTESAHGQEARKSLEPLMNDPKLAPEAAAAAIECFGWQNRFFSTLSLAVLNGG